MQEAKSAPSSATVIIHFKDFERDDVLFDALEQRCKDLASTFPETARFELTLYADTSECSANGHVSGKGVDAAAHATGRDARQAGERVLDKLERELRRDHDKRIFARRRDAQRSSPHHHSDD